MKYKYPNRTVKRLIKEIEKVEDNFFYGGYNYSISEDFTLDEVDEISNLWEEHKEDFLKEEFQWHGFYMNEPVYFLKEFVDNKIATILKNMKKAELILKAISNSEDGGQK